MLIYVTFSYGGGGEAMTVQVSRGYRAFIGDHPLAAFGTLVVLFPAAFAGPSLARETAPFALIFVPAVAALLVAAVADGRAGVSRLFGRVARWRVAPRWYAAAIGIPVLMWISIDVLGVLLGTPVENLFHNLGEIPL